MLKTDNPFKRKRKKRAKKKTFGQLFGKVNRTHRGKSGTYKGVSFRSCYEYSFMKHLEKQGIDITDPEQLKAEPFFIKYFFKGRFRKYYPDFLVLPQKKLIEIKPFFQKGNEMVEAKKRAAEEYCSQNDLIYEIVTERDFYIIPYKLVYIDRKIQWTEKSSSRRFKPAVNKERVE